MSAPIAIGGHVAPDSELTRKATALIDRIHTPVIRNHLHRTWWFADFLGKKRGLKYDREVVYFASLMHDLGFTKEYCADQRFEVDGADAAKQFLLEHGYSEAKAELVWDGIALHSSGGIADRKAPEIALIYFGAHVDVFGLNIQEISPALIDDTLALYPRLGMKAAFQEALAEVVRKKPHTAIGTGLRDIGHRHVHGFSCPDVCSMIDAAPFES
jgi:hypothetical protein